MICQCVVFGLIFMSFPFCYLTVLGCRVIEDIGAYKHPLLAIPCHDQMLLRFHSAPSHLLHHLLVLFPWTSSVSAAGDSARHRQFLKTVCSHYMSKNCHLSFPQHRQQPSPTSNNLQNVIITPHFCPNNF